MLVGSGAQQAQLVCELRKVQMRTFKGSWSMVQTLESLTCGSTLTQFLSIQSEAPVSMMNDELGVSTLK